MGLETGVTYIDDLDETWPLGSDDPDTLDNHDRNIKTAVKGSLPNLGASAVTATAAELNIMDGVTKTTDEINNSGQIVSETVVATTSGSSKDFTGIPSWVKKITVILDEVSTDNASWNLQVQIGDSGGIEATGYKSEGGKIEAGASSATISSTTGFALFSTGVAATTASGIVTLVNITGNRWIMSGVMGDYTGPPAFATYSTGAKTLTGTLDRVRLVAGAGAFDAGQVNILYEG